MQTTSKETSVAGNAELRPLGVWVGIAANIIAACGGAVFFLAEPGARFRGMEPEAGAFLMLSVLAGLLGLLGLLLSLHEMFWRRLWLSGIAGFVLALTPVLTAVVVSDIAVWQLELVWD